MPSQSLEQEALDRVARMYSSFDRRSRTRAPLTQPAPADHRQQTAEKPSDEPKTSEPKPEHQPNNSIEEKSAGLLDILLKDKEQSLILLLLVILMKDGADMNTVLALMYLLI